MSGEESESKFTSPKKQSPIKKLYLRKIRTPDRITYEIIQQKPSTSNLTDEKDEGNEEFDFYGLEASYSESSQDENEIEGCCRSRESYENEIRQTEDELSKKFQASVVVGLEESWNENQKIGKQGNRIEESECFSPELGVTVNLEEGDRVQEEEIDEAPSPELGLSMEWKKDPSRELGPATEWNEGPSPELGLGPELGPSNFCREGPSPELDQLGKEKDVPSPELGLLSESRDFQNPELGSSTDYKDVPSPELGLSLEWKIRQNIQEINRHLSRVKFATEVEDYSEIQSPRFGDHDKVQNSVFREEKEKGPQDLSRKMEIIPEDDELDNVPKKHSTLEAKDVEESDSDFGLIVEEVKNIDFLKKSKEIHDYSGKIEKSEGKKIQLQSTKEENFSEKIKKSDTKKDRALPQSTKKENISGKVRKTNLEKKENSVRKPSTKNNHEITKIDKEKENKVLVQRSSTKEVVTNLKDCMASLERRSPDLFPSDEVDSNDGDLDNKENKNMKFELKNLEKHDETASEKNKDDVLDEVDDEESPDDRPFVPLPSAPVAIKLVDAERKFCPRFLELTEKEVQRILPWLPEK
ncbi:hypothetical protein FO519_005129 [Halicephalobus sp. NKZ332]|nr:hypothetical protein FO519_005129 [Halicephalobus sp. NKZ332]